MSCPTSKCLCDKLVVSTQVTFDGVALLVTLPAGSYMNRNKYCVIIAQDIPTETLINAPVFFLVGTSPIRHRLVHCDGTDVIAKQISSRVRYSTKVYTGITSGVFKLLGDICCDHCRRIETEELPQT